MNDATFRMDEILLLMTIPAFFMDFIFSIVPAITNGALLPICIPTFRLAQVLIQTPFLIDGIRRCSNSKFLQKKKIGRGFIIFLAIANMSIWIYNTFSSKTISTSDFRYLTWIKSINYRFASTFFFLCFNFRYTFYGYILWNILNHISLPLIMFYRFHASVLLIDIWNHAYKSERKHQWNHIHHTSIIMFESLVRWNKYDFIWSFNWLFTKRSKRYERREEKKNHLKLNIQLKWSIVHILAVIVCVKWKMSHSRKTPTMTINYGNGGIRLNTPFESKRTVQMNERIEWENETEKFVCNECKNSTLMHDYSISSPRQHNIIGFECCHWTVNCCKNNAFNSAQQTDRVLPVFDPFKSKFNFSI